MAAVEQRKLLTLAPAQLSPAVVAVLVTLVMVVKVVDTPGCL